MVLVNPHAGRGGFRTVLGGVLQTFCQGGYTPTVFFTDGPGAAPVLVQRNAAAFDLVVCLGGDGTLSETCAGMMRLGADKRPIGYIPLGTTNDVARTLQLPQKPADAAKRVLSGAPRPFDIGRFGPDDYFTYVAAFGAFTEVSYGTPQESKQALGHMAYMLEGIRHLSKITSCHAIVEYDDGVIEDDFLFGAATNTISVAGLVRLGESSDCLSDGLFEVLLIRQPKDILETGEILSGVLSSNFSGPNVLFFKSRELRVMFDEPVAGTRDGEDGGLQRVICINNWDPGVEIIA